MYELLLLIDLDTNYSLLLEWNGYPTTQQQQRQRTKKVSTYASVLVSLDIRHYYFISNHSQNTTRSMESRQSELLRVKIEYQFKFLFSLIIEHHFA